MRWVEVVALAGALLGAAAVARPRPAGSAASAPVPAAQLPVDTVFRHANHRSYPCARCHSGGAEHGVILIRTRADCRSCHHNPPVAQSCTTCHRDEARSDRLFAESRTLTLPRGATATRALPFRHALHEGVACASCHESPDVSARTVDCAGCHADHHREGATCSTCHVQAPAAVHPLAVHAGCAGSGCHEDAPFEGVPRDRSACLVCHQDRAEHRPGRECVNCHVLPPASMGGPLGVASRSARR